MNTTTNTTAKKKYIFTVGRRKEAVARVKLFSGKGSNLVNTKDIKVYFPLENAPLSYDKPFQVTSTLGKFYFEASIVGGGYKSQLDALTLALSRAIVKTDEGHRTSLRQNGLLTVDSRIRQRRHVGTGGKARRQKQSPRR